MADVGALRALLLTTEGSTVASFNAVCGELGIEAHSSPAVQDIDRQLEEQKYAAVVLDFDNPDAGPKQLPKLQQSRLNKNAVVVAVAATARNLQQALQCRAHFVLQRPIEDAAVRRTLRAAYDMMLADRRRHFRCPTVLTVRIKPVRSGATSECSTINISSNGVAISGTQRLKTAESLDLEITLPDGFAVLASGIVVWDDQRGKSGINFQCRTPEIRQKLDTWLMSQAAALAKAELTRREFSDILPRTEIDSLETAS